jgi:hypothetical protein
MPKRALAGTVRSILFGIVAVAANTSCNPLGPNESVDVYDVTTTFDTFFFETAAPSPPDCPFTPNMSPYCTHARAFSGATLTGMMSLTASGDSLIPAGTFSGKMCSAYDVSAPTGCTAVMERTDEYGPGFSASRIQSDGSTINISMRVGSGSDFQPLLGLSGKVLGDTIRGTILWSAAPGRSPPTHRGEFVAVRR